MRINRNQIKNNDFAQSLKKFANSNFVAKIVIGISIWLLAFVPMWIYLFSRMLIDPVGFWQELALFIIFAIVVGWLQVILIIFGLALTFLVMSDEL